MQTPHIFFQEWQGSTCLKYIKTIKTTCIILYRLPLWSKGSWPVWHWDVGSGSFVGCEVKPSWIGVLLVHMDLMSVEAGSVHWRHCHIPWAVPVQFDSTKGKAITGRTKKQTHLSVYSIRRQNTFTVFWVTTTKIMQDTPLPPTVVILLYIFTLLIKNNPVICHSSA